MASGVKGAAILEMLMNPEAWAIDGKIRESSEQLYGDDEEISGNLDALFWVRRDEIGLTEDEAVGYKADLIGKGATLNRELVDSLSPGERNELYENFFMRHLPEDVGFVSYRDENAEDVTWLYYGAAAAEWRERYTQKKVSEKLATFGMKGGGKFIFIFSDPMDKAGFFTRYHALALEQNTVTAHYDFARWIRGFGKPLAVGLSEVAVVDGIFTVGNRTFTGRA